jgi:hypothetical protein
MTLADSNGINDDGKGASSGVIVRCPECGHLRSAHSSSRGYRCHGGDALNPCSCRVHRDDIEQPNEECRS